MLPARTRQIRRILSPATSVSGQIEHQEFRSAVSGIRNSQGALATYRRSVTGRQLRAVHIEFAADQLYPCVTLRLEFQVYGFPAIEYGSIDAGVLMNRGRACAPVLRRNQQQTILLLFRSKGAILVARLQPFGF